VACPSCTSAGRRPRTSADMEEPKSRGWAAACFEPQHDAVLVGVTGEVRRAEDQNCPQTSVLAYIILYCDLFI